MKNILVKLDSNAYMPERAYPTDAGLDLRTPCDFTIDERGFYTVDTGVHVAIPEGYVGFIKSKSGLNVKKDITGEGVIDAGYTGSIRVKLYNHGYESHTFKAGDKISQLVILPIVTPEPIEVDELKETDRGDNGFGSTGR